MKEQLSTETLGIRNLFATRSQSIISNYGVLQLRWEESLEFVTEAEMRSRIMGISLYMQSFDFFFGLPLGELLIRHSDNLIKTLQETPGARV